MLHCDPSHGLSRVKVPKLPDNHACFDLPPRDSWLRHDLEERVVVPRCHPGHWLLDNGILRWHCQSYHHYRHVKCGRPHEEELHGGYYLCRVLCRYVFPATTIPGNFIKSTRLTEYSGNIVGPQLVRSESKADHYPELWLGLIIWYAFTRPRCASDDLSNQCFSYIICIFAATALYFILRSENKRRENFPEDETERAKLAFMDLTDKENPYFKYVL